MWYPAEWIQNEEIGFLSRPVPAQVVPPFPGRISGFQLIVNEAGVNRIPPNRALTLVSRRRVAYRQGPFSGLYCLPPSPESPVSTWRRDTVCVVGEVVANGGFNP